MPDGVSVHPVYRGLWIRGSLRLAPVTLAVRGTCRLDYNALAGPAANSRRQPHEL